MRLFPVMVLLCAGLAGLWWKAGALDSARPQDEQLQFEVSYVSIDRLRASVEKGASLDERDMAGRTPLLCAVMLHRAEAVRLLVAAGADLNIADNLGWTPATAAATSGYDEILDCLIRAGADLSAANWDGRTPLDLAILHDHSDATRMLKKASPIERH